MLSRELCVALVLLLPASCLANLNVYGTALQPCGDSQPGSGEGSHCTYRDYDRGAHQVCILKLPGGFSSKTGQGPWSDAHTGSSWCICIWAWASFVVNHNAQNLQQELKCHSVPSQVLDTSSLPNLKSCGRMGSQCPDFVAALRVMCQRCHEQAGSDSERQELESKCLRILTNAGDSGADLLSYTSSTTQAAAQDTSAVLSSDPSDEL